MTGCPFSGGLFNGLKMITQDLHDQTEAHNFQRKFAEARLSREEYVDYLGQMLLIHKPLEAAIRNWRGEVEALNLIPEVQFQEPYLLQDLAHFGIEAETLVASPAVREFAESLELLSGEDAIRLLGYHYVLEGSNNGSRIIAKRIREPLGLEEGIGDRYLDPYGSEQRKFWTEFKESVNSTSFSTEESMKIAEAARQMFQVITSLSNDLVQTAA